MEYILQSVNVIWQVFLTTLFFLLPGTAFWLVVVAVAMTVRRLKHTRYPRKSMNQQKVVLT